MRLYGLIGKPLTHSFSKTFFTKKFAAEKLYDCLYENFELPSIEHFSHLLIQHPELCGLNITIPYKEEILTYLHFQNDIVQKVGACNCIKIMDGKLYGFNTDVIGFQKTLQEKLKPHHTKALILGTGGAAKAVAFALGLLGITHQYVSRKDSDKTLAYANLNQPLMEDYLLIINTTPLGMYPKIDSTPELPYRFIGNKHLLYDLTYNPAKTLFLQKGEEQSATICNGYQMLIIQAEESWKIWNS
jgi:shikimate dehydrogenase